MASGRNKDDVDDVDVDDADVDDVDVDGDDVDDDEEGAGAYFCSASGYTGSLRAGGGGNCNLLISEWWR